LQKETRFIGQRTIKKWVPLKIQHSMQTEVRSKIPTQPIGDR